MIENDPEIDIQDKILKYRAMTRHFILIMMGVGLVVGFVVSIFGADTFADRVELLKWLAGLAAPFFAFLFGERGALKVPGKD